MRNIYNIGFYDISYFFSTLIAVIFLEIPIDFDSMFVFSACDVYI